MMKRTFFTIAAMALALPGLAAAVETEAWDQKYEQRFAEIESQLAALNQESQRLPAVETAPSCGCCCAAPPTGFYGGAEIVFAKPFLKESFRASTVDLSGTQTLLPYEYEYEAAPRFWLGYVGANRTGIQARYWKLDQDQGPENFVADGFSFPGTQNVTLIFPAAISTDAPGEVLSVSSGIQLETLDVEGTLHFNGWGNNFVASAGLQYARISQDYRSAVIAGGVPEQVLNWDRRLEGVGPTLGVQARRPLGSWGLEIIGGAKVALIYGEKNIHRFSFGGPQVQFGGVPTVQFEGADELLITGQVQLGAQWTRELAWGGDFFVRGAYEGQVWTDSGGNALGYLGVQGFGLAIGVSK